MRLFAIIDRCLGWIKRIDRYPFAVDLTVFYLCNRQFYLPNEKLRLLYLMFYEGLHTKHPKSEPFKLFNFVILLSKVNLIF